MLKLSIAVLRRADCFTFSDSAEGEVFKQFIFSSCAKGIKDPLLLRNGSFSLRTMGILLHNVVKERGLFDPKNPYIIVCDEPSTQALGSRVFTTPRLLEFVRKRLVLSESKGDSFKAIDPSQLPLDAAAKDHFLDCIEKGKPTWGDPCLLSSELPHVAERVFPKKRFRYLIMKEFDLHFVRSLHGGTVPADSHRLEECLKDFLKKFSSVSDERDKIRIIPSCHPFSKLIGGALYLAESQLRQVIVANSLMCAPRPSTKQAGSGRARTLLEPKQSDDVGGLYGLLAMRCHLQSLANKKV